MNTNVNKVNINLAKAFGLDIENLHKFKLEVSPNQLPTIVATYFVVVDFNLELIEKKFKLEVVD